MAAMTWNDDEESDSEEEAEPKKVLNLCLMPHEEENAVSTSNSSQFSFNELQDAFDDLMVKFKKVRIKNILLKKIFLLFSKKMKTY